MSHIKYCNIHTTRLKFIKQYDRLKNGEETSQEKTESTSSP